MTNFQKQSLWTILTITFLFLCKFSDIFILFTIAGFFWTYYYFWKIVVIQAGDEIEEKVDQENKKLPRSVRRRIWKKTWQNFK